MHDATSPRFSSRTRPPVRSHPPRVPWRKWLISARARIGGQIAWHAALPLLAYAVAYLVALYAASALSFALSPNIEGPFPLYLTGAVTVPAFLVTPPRRWWLYLVLTLALLPIDARLLNLMPSAALLVVILFLYINFVCISVITASLLGRFVPLPLRFASISEFGRFLACVAAGAVPAALIAAVGRTVIFSWDFLVSWQIGYLGYVLGIVVFTPVILLWLAEGPRGLRLASRWQRIEFALLIVATVALGTLVFGTSLADLVVAHALVYMVVPVLIWAAVRFGPQGIASALALATAIAVTGAVFNRGPFVASTPVANVLALQLFLLFVGVPLFFLAALVQERKVADAAVRASEERFRAAFESAATGMMLVDLSGRILRANQPVVEILGYTEDDLRARTFVDVTHPDDVEPNLTLLRRAVAGEIDSYHLEKRYIHKDGHLVWGRVSAGLVRDAGGRPSYIVGQLEDITERKQLAQALAEQADQLDRVFEGMGDAVFVFDSGGHIVRINRAARRLLALDAAPPGFYDSSIPERLTLFAVRRGELDGERAIFPEEGPVVRALGGDTLNGTEAQDLRLRALDGRELEVDVSAAPLRDAEGRANGAVVILQDRSERNRLTREREQALRSSEAWFRGMADTAPVFLWVSDTEGAVNFVNASWLRFTGRRLEQELGDGWADGIHPDDLERCLFTYQTAFHARQPFTMEYRLRRADGAYRLIIDSGVARYAADGAFAGYIGSALDVTEREELKREREEARAGELAQREIARRMDSFLAIASHDVRNPVTVTVGAVDIAQQHVEQVAERAGALEAQAQTISGLSGLSELADWVDLEREVTRAYESVDMAHEAADRLSQVVAVLFDTAQARAGRLKVHPEPCDLATLVRRQVAAMCALAPTRTIALDLPGNEAVSVVADPVRIGQVVTNYLANALRYAPGERPVEVKMAAQAERVVVAVRDEGPGLAEGERRRVWEMFYHAPRVEARTDPVGELATGLGVGLHICKVIVEAHGGEVGVESQVGRGSTFWFSLPRYARVTQDGR